MSELGDQEVSQDVEVLRPEQAKQRDAINIVHDYFVNKVFG